MLPFLEKIFSKKDNRSKIFLDRMKTMSNLSTDINTKKQQLNDVTTHVALENKNDLFISLAEFLQIMEQQDFDMSYLLSKFKHVTEISSQNYSTIDVYPIVEDNHIVLCPDISNCDIHNGKYKGDALKIVSVRRL